MNVQPCRIIRHINRRGELGGLIVTKTVCLDRLEGGISGYGPKARASMVLYRTSDYTATYPAGVVSLPVGSALYVGVLVDKRDPSLAVVLEDCFATHSSNPNSPTRYSLIQNKYVFALSKGECNHYLET